MSSVDPSDAMEDGRCTLCGEVPPTVQEAQADICDSCWSTFESGMERDDCHAPPLELCGGGRE